MTPRDLKVVIATSDHGLVSVLDTEQYARDWPIRIRVTADYLRIMAERIEGMVGPDGHAMIVLLTDPRARPRPGDPEPVAAAREALRDAVAEAERLRELRLAAVRVREEAELELDDAETEWACPCCRGATEVGPEHATCRECGGSGWRQG